MKKVQSIRLDEEIIESISEIGWWNFTQWLITIYTFYNTNHNTVSYDDMKNVFKDLVDIVKKYKPTDETSIVQNVNKLQDITKGENLPEPVEIKWTYNYLYMKLKPFQKQTLEEIIKSTSKWNLREDGEEYTRQDLLKAKWFSQFIWLV